METRHTIDPLQPKTWQIDEIENGNEGYLYHCILCDEALVLSKQQINPNSLRRNLSQLRLRTRQGLRLQSLPSSRRETPPHQLEM
jgi:hypothetical protein